MLTIVDDWLFIRQLVLLLFLVTFTLLRTLCTVRTEEAGPRPLAHFHIPCSGQREAGPHTPFAPGMFQTYFPTARP